MNTLQYYLLIQKAKKNRMEKRWLGQNQQYINNIKNIKDHVYESI